MPVPRPMSTPRSRTARAFSGSSAPPSTRSRSRCIWLARRSGCRSRPKAPPSAVMQGNGFGFNWRGLYVTSLLDAHRGWRTAPTNCPTLSRTRCCSGTISRKHYRGHLLRQGAEPDRAGCARPMTRRWRNYDLLLMPTLPMKATPLPPRTRRANSISRASKWCRIRRRLTPRQDPAMSMPCGMSRRTAGCDAGRQILR